MRWTRVRSESDESDESAKKLAAKLAAKLRNAGGVYLSCSRLRAAALLR